MKKNITTITLKSPTSTYRKNAKKRKTKKKKRLYNKYRLISRAVELHKENQKKKKNNSIMHVKEL